MNSMAMKFGRWLACIAGSDRESMRKEGVLTLGEQQQKRGFKSQGKCMLRVVEEITDLNFRLARGRRSL